MQSPTSNALLQTKSPQQYLDSMLQSRGYSNHQYEALNSAYYNTPTTLQRASYQSRLIQAVSDTDGIKIRQMLASGLSPNPCNAFSESLVHAVCRRGLPELLQVFLQAGACVHISDDYGRTPMHDACWSAQPCFETIFTLLHQGPGMLHMQDARGSLPLAYVHKDHWPVWVTFLESHRDVFWPLVVKAADQDTTDATPSTTVHAAAFEPANSRPIPDPENALPIDLACLVASGRLDPAQVMLPSDSSSCDRDDLGYGGTESMTESDANSSDDDESDEDNGVVFAIGEIQIEPQMEKFSSYDINNDDDSLSRTSCTTDYDSEDDDDDDISLDEAEILAGMLKVYALGSTII